MEREPTTPPAAPQRLEGLDALRGIAACVVAFGYHSQYLFAPGTFAPNWGGAVGLWFHTLGWTAVDLFFVLSGYVFAHVYLRGADLTRAAGQQQFWMARIARLYPLHLVMLLFSALLFRNLADNTALAFAAHVTMVQALVDPVGLTFVGPTWSLSVEVMCYAVFALGLGLGRRALLWTTWLAAAAGLYALFHFGASSDLHTGSAVGRGLLGFFVGQLLWRSREVLARIPVLVLGGAVGAGFAIGPELLGPVVPLSLLGWPALVLLALRTPLMRARPLAWLGDRSYAIYLLHMPMIDAVAFSTGGLGGSGASILLGHLCLICVVLVTADIVYRRFELPARDAVRAVWRRHQGAAVAVST